MSGIVAMKFDYLCVFFGKKLTSNESTSYGMNNQIPAFPTGG